MTRQVTRGRTHAAPLVAPLALIVALVVAITVVGLWHLTQGTSGLGMRELVLYAVGHPDAPQSVNGVPVDSVLSGSRVPRLLAGITVGFALGVAGILLQSVTRNQLASPDTLAVTAGSYVALTAVAAFGLTVPFWASGLVAFCGGLASAALVLSLTGAGSGRGGATGTTKLILAGSAIAMALDAVTGMLLILFKQNTTGLFAWGSGSLSQLSVDASARAVPVIVAVLLAAVLLSRRLDVLSLGDDDTATTLGVPVRATRTIAVVLAVLLTALSVTVAGPLGFIGLGAPVLARLLSTKVPGLRRHAVLIPVTGLVGALIVLLADALLRAVLGAEQAASIPTGIPTALLGAVVIVVLAMRMRDQGVVRAARANAGARGGTSTPAQARRRFLVVLVAAVVLLVAAVVYGLLAGSLWLRLGDIALWLRDAAPGLVGGALDTRAPRVTAAVLAGAALGVAGTVVQGTVRNPLAEPGLLGITAGAGLGAVIATTMLPGSGRTVLVALAVTTGLATFALVAALSWRGGLLPDRFVLIGIGCGYGISSVTTFLLLRANPYDTPRIFTWLSGTTYGRTFPDVVPVAVVLLLTLPVLLAMRRQIDLMSVDEDTPRILGVPVERTRLGLLTLAAVLAAVSVVAVGVVGFVGLVAPHLARSLVGGRHGRVLPVAMVLGAAMVCLADGLGRSVIAPAQIPAGLMIALVGAPYFVWLLRRT
ncbi:MULTISPECIES: iron ABC transporter permease [unclassified Corynebacterium]|uniref:iron ABC transporter permease n=1 Tax=unclassified Corynebacterium TaxID=2624378 RepID=UPI00265665A9|nr:iron ABC transporter permease [Corynebacterium sp.]MDN6323860.1 iron ABC transporter permease [Corynebacterium sp.]